MLQIIQVGIVGVKIIDGNLYVEFFEFVQDFGGWYGVLYQVVFGYFQFKVLWFEVGFIENGVDVGEKVFVVKFGC